MCPLRNASWRGCILFLHRVGETRRPVYCVCIILSISCSLAWARIRHRVVTCQLGGGHSPARPKATQFDSILLVNLYISGGKARGGRARIMERVAPCTCKLVSFSGCNRRGCSGQIVCSPRVSNSPHLPCLDETGALRKSKEEAAGGFTRASKAPRKSRLITCC